MELMEETEGNEQDSALIWAIRYLECDAVEEGLAAGVTQHLLDCGLHEVATGERDIPAHQESRLHIAQLLVECGADPDNRQHGCGGTPLHHSLARGYLELVKFLLDAQADVNACNRHGVHPLHIAVKRGYCDCIEYLMKWGLPLQKVKEELSWAVKFDMSESVCCLLSNGAPHGLRVQCPPSALSTRHRNARDYSLPLGYYVVMRGWHIEVMLDVLCKGWTRLQEAVACGRVEEATKIIEGVADDDPTIWEPSKPYNASLLHLAVFSGSVPMLNMLLGLTTSGLSACCTDCFKRSALCYAACKEEPMMAIELIAASCDPNLQDRDGRTALHIAASMGHTQTLEVLLRSGGDPMILDVHKNTCVHCAAIEGKCSALSLLMSHEPALFALYERNSDELTPVHQATSMGDTRCLEVLLNADPFLVDLRVKDEGTSLHIACEKGHASALRLLLRAGGDVEAHVTQFEDPRTPLHLAAEYAHEDCVALMLEYGADVFAELPIQFLQQFKNFRLLSHHLKRASCHAAALSAHFKDEGWKQCVALLDSAVEARRLSGLSNRSTRQAALSLSTAIAEVKGNHDGATPRMGKSFTDGGGPRMKHNTHANGLTAVQQATGRRREQHNSAQADKSGDSQSTTSLFDAQFAARDTESARDPEAKGKFTTIVENTKRFAKILMDYSISRSLSTEYGNPLPTAFLLEARSEVCEALSLHGIAFAGFDELVCSQDDVSMAWNFDHNDAELRECNWSVIQAIADLLRRFPVIHLQVHCESCATASVPKALRSHWGPRADAAFVLERVAELRATACTRALIACGADSSRLFTSYHGQGESFEVDFFPHDLRRPRKTNGSFSFATLSTSCSDGNLSDKDDADKDDASGCADEEKPKKERSALVTVHDEFDSLGQHAALAHIGPTGTMLTEATSCSDQVDIQDQINDHSSTGRAPPKDDASTALCIRHQWWQTQTHVVVDILGELPVAMEEQQGAAHQNLMSTSFEESRVFVRLDTPLNYSLSLWLAHPVRPSQCKAVVSKGKISLQLRKCEAVRWNVLERPSGQVLSATSSNDGARAMQPSLDTRAASNPFSTESYGPAKQSLTAGAGELPIKSELPSTDASNVYTAATAGSGDSRPENGIQSVTAYTAKQKSNGRLDTVSTGMEKLHSGGCKGVTAETVTQSSKQAQAQAKATSRESGKKVVSTAAVHHEAEELLPNTVVLPAENLLQPALSSRSFFSMIADPQLSAENIASNLLEAGPSPVQPGPVVDLVDLVICGSFFQEDLQKNECERITCEARQGADWLIMSTLRGADVYVQALVTAVRERNTNERPSSQNIPLVTSSAVGMPAEAVYSASNSDYVPASQVDSIPENTHPASGDACVEDVCDKEIRLQRESTTAGSNDNTREKLSISTGSNTCQRSRSAAAINHVPAVVSHQDESKSFSGVSDSTCEVQDEIPKKREPQQLRAPVSAFMTHPTQVPMKFSSENEMSSAPQEYERVHQERMLTECEERAPRGELLTGREKERHKHEHFPAEQLRQPERQNRPLQTPIRAQQHGYLNESKQPTARMGSSPTHVLARVNEKEQPSTRVTPTADSYTGFMHRGYASRSSMDSSLKRSTTDAKQAPESISAVGNSTGISANGTDDVLEDSMKMLAEDMIGDLWDAEEGSGMGSLFSDLACGLADGSVDASSQPISALRSATTREQCCGTLANTAMAETAFPSPNGPPDLGAFVDGAWRTSCAPSHLHRSGTLTSSSYASTSQGMPLNVTSRDLSRSGAAARSSDRSIMERGGTRVAGSDGVLSQDPTKDWRCKCGTFNKAGSHLCSSRSCHCYFCLGCGQLGHQQRFCRKAPSHVPSDATSLNLNGGLRPENAPSRVYAAATVPPNSTLERPAELRPLQFNQDPGRDWRCKCNTLNKAGTFQCAKRGCRVFFCLICGQLGHQQRFCRQGSPNPSSVESGAVGHLRLPRRSTLSGEIDLDKIAECVVCMDSPAYVTLFPCAHQITCSGCTHALLELKKPCPFCSSEIAGTDLGKGLAAWRIPP